MSNGRTIQPVSAQARFQQLERELAEAQEALRQSEAELAQEQAEVNAFRMHCRLKLGPWVEEIQELNTEKQRLLTLLTMWQQASEHGQPFDPQEWYETGSEEEPTPHFEEEQRERPDESWEDGRPIVDPLPSDRKAEKRLYRELARRFHPDLVEDALLRSYATSMMAAVNEAYARGDVQALHDLAGELDPEAVGQIETEGQAGPKLKALQNRLRKCRQRQRKIHYQLKTLQEEMVARLWRKAQMVDAPDGENWWDEVTTQLKGDIARIKKDITALQTQLQGMGTMARSTDEGGS